MDTFDTLWRCDPIFRLFYSVVAEHATKANGWVCRMSIILNKMFEQIVQRKKENLEILPLMKHFDAVD